MNAGSEEFSVLDLWGSVQLTSLQLLVVARQHCDWHLS